MSDALLTRIAEGVEKLIALHSGGLVPASAIAEPPKPKKASAKNAATAPASTTSAAAAVTAAAQPATPAPCAAPEKDLMTQTADAVIDLANNYDRDAAIEEMAKFGAQKVSQVKQEHLAPLLHNVQVRITAEKAKKSNASLI